MSRFPVVLGPVRLSKKAALGQPGGARWFLSGPSSIGQADEEKDLAQIESAVRDIATELHLRVRRIAGELGFARDDELRKGIPFVGKDFSKSEVMSQIALVGRGLTDVAESILNGPLSAYATQEVQSVLSDAVNDLRGIISTAEGQSQPIAEGHEGLAEEHLLSYVDDLKELRDAAERLMVSSEKAPPIYEEGEKERMGAKGVLTAIGALAVGGLLVYLLSN